MKKVATTFTIIGLLLLALGIGVFCLLPTLLGTNGTFYTLSGAKWSDWTNVLKALVDFQNIGIVQIAIFIAGGTGLVIFIVSILVCVGKRRPIGLVCGLLGFLSLLLFLAYAVFTLHPNYTNGFWVDPLDQVVDNGKYGWLSMAKEASANGKFPHLLIVPIISFASAALGYALTLFGTFLDMVLGRPNPKKEKEPKPVEDVPEEDAIGAPSPIVVHDDEIIPPTSGEDIDAALGFDTPISRKSPEAAPTQTPPAPPVPPSPASPIFAGSGGGIQGPLLVQYINTYSPNAGETVSSPASKHQGSVPVSEIQGAISGEKPLSLEDIRKIVREEIAPKEEERQPVIISVPSPAKDESKSLTPEDVRRIFSEELERTLGKDKGAEDVVVEETVPAPTPLTVEDIRAVISEEIKASQPKPEPVPEPAPAPAPAPAMSEKDIREAIAEELRAYFVAQKEAKKPEPAVPPTPTISASEIRQIINEEFARREPREVKSELTPNLIREIIRQEMLTVPPIKEEKIQPVTVVVKAPQEEQPAEEPKPEPAPEPKPESVPMPAPVTIVVQTPPEAPVQTPASAPKPRVVGAINPNLPPHDKIIRIPFQTRMASADPDMVDNYNLLKSEIMSYGVKSRISNKGDTFRLHKKTFVKITIAGKSLKLYFALDPRDYANSPIPVQDAGHVGVYRDIPLIFKVRSPLSLNRAKELIAAVMEKNGLEQGKVVSKNWASEIPPAKEDESDEE